MQNKPKLIILPGWNGTNISWQKFIDLAKEKFEVECIELPCFGSEPCPSQVWGVEDYADYVKNKVPAQGWSALGGKSPCLAGRQEKSKVILLGHSFGGAVATYLVANNPGLIDKLILSGAAVYRPKRPVYRTIFLVIAKIGKQIFKLPILNKFSGFAEKVLHKISGTPDYGETSGIKRLIFQKVIKQDLSHLLAKIDIPTLVVWGSRDSYVPLKYGKKIAENISGSKFEIFKNGKHGLHIQMPDKLLEIIDRFVKIT